MQTSIPIPEVAGVTHSYREINGIKMHIAEAGKGKPLVLIHGWPQHWYVWRKIVPLLSHKYKLIMPDLPGFGWSEPPKNNDFRKEKLAEYIVALVKNLQLSTVTLVGHDWGGWIGFLCCLQKPEKFTNFLALGIANPLQSTQIAILQYRRFLYQLPIASPFIGKLLLTKFPSFIEWAIKNGTYKKGTWTEKELRVFSDMLQYPITANASSLLYRDFLIKEFIPIALGKYKNKKLEVPTSLLIGDVDPVIHPSLFKNFTNPTNNITITTIKACGHFIPEEKPEIVAKEVINFLRV